MTDRPTVIYTPQTGSEFTRNLTNPLPTASILNLIESGRPADVVTELVGKLARVRGNADPPRNLGILAKLDSLPIPERLQ